MDSWKSGRYSKLERNKLPEEKLVLKRDSSYSELDTVIGKWSRHSLRSAPPVDARNRTKINSSATDWRSH